MENEKIITPVSLPRDLRRDLREIADKEGRSLSGQGRFLVEAVTRKNTASISIGERAAR